MNGMMMQRRHGAGAMGKRVCTGAAGGLSASASVSGARRVVKEKRNAEGTGRQAASGTRAIEKRNAEGTGRQAASGARACVVSVPQVRPGVRPSPGPSLRGRGAGNAAFTLLEMVLAITIGLALASTAIWFYQHTGDVREDVTSHIEEVAARRLVMDRITNELRAAYTVPLLDLALQGTTDQMTFTTTALPGPTSWAVQGIAENPLPPEQDLRLVTYGLRIVEDEDGRQYIAGLETSVQKLINVAVVQTEEEAESTALTPAEEEEAQQVESVLLSPYVGFVRFRYWTGTEWSPEWAQQGLPQAVEVALGREPIEEGLTPEEYPGELAIRIVYLPGATAAEPEGTVIRGLGGGG